MLNLSPAIEHGPHQVLGTVPQHVAGGQPQFLLDSFPLGGRLFGAELAAVHGHTDHSRGERRDGHRFVNVPDRRQGRDRDMGHAANRRAAALVAQDHAVGEPAVQQSGRYRRVPWVAQAALTFKQQDIMVLVGQHEFLHRAVDENPTRRNRRGNRPLRS